MFQCFSLISLLLFLLCRSYSYLYVIKNLFVLIKYLSKKFQTTFLFSRSPSFFLCLILNLGHYFNKDIRQDRIFNMLMKVVKMYPFCKYKLINFWYVKLQSHDGMTTYSRKHSRGRIVFEVLLDVSLSLCCRITRKTLFVMGLFLLTSQSA